MPQEVQIDPVTGERLVTIEIDPSTGERIEAFMQIPRAEPPDPQREIRTRGLDYLQGLKETTIPSDVPSDYYQGPAYMARHPLESLKMLGRSIGESQQVLSEKEQEAIEEGERVKSLGYGAASAMPVIGPLAVSVAEAPTVARGLGRLTGIFAPQLAGKALSKVRPTKAVGEVPLTGGDIGGPTKKIFQGLVEKSLPGQTVFPAFRQKQQLALMAQADRILSEISPAGLSSEQIGHQVIGQLGEYIQAQKETFNIRYGEVDALTKSEVRKVPKLTETLSSIVGPRGEPLTFAKKTMVKEVSGGVMPETKTLKQFAIKELRRIKEKKSLMPESIYKEHSETLKAILKSPNQVTYQAMQGARSDLLAISRQVDSLVGNKGQATAKQLAKLTDRAMTEAAENSGNPELASKVRELGQDYSRFMGQVDQTFDVVVSAAKSRPEDVGRQLSSLPLQSLRDLRMALPKETWQSMKEVWLRQVFESSVKGENLRPEIGSIVPGASEAVRGEVLVLNPDKLRVALEGAGRRSGGHAASRLGEILNPREQLAIEGLIDVAVKARPSRGGLFLPIMNVGMIAAVISDLTQADLVGLGGDVAAAGTIAVLAKVMTKPEGLGLVRKFAASVGNAREAQFWGQRIVNTIKQDENDRWKPGQAVKVQLKE